VNLDTANNLAALKSLSCWRDQFPAHPKMPRPLTVQMDSQIFPP
jgi:hypothetical protein